jgi:hypothetical protein
MASFMNRILTVLLTATAMLPARAIRPSFAFSHRSSGGLTGAGPVGGRVAIELIQRDEERPPRVSPNPLDA